MHYGLLKWKVAWLGYTTCRDATPHAATSWHLRVSSHLPRLSPMRTKHPNFEWRKPRSHAISHESIHVYNRMCINYIYMYMYGLDQRRIDRKPEIFPLNLGLSSKNSLKAIHIFWDSFWNAVWDLFWHISRDSRDILFGIHSDMVCGMYSGIPCGPSVWYIFKDSF